MVLRQTIKVFFAVAESLTRRVNGVLMTTSGLMIVASMGKFVFAAILSFVHRVLILIFHNYCSEAP